MWNADTGAIVHDTPGDWLLTMAVVPGTTEVITANSDFRLRRRDIVSGQILEVYEGHTTSTTSGVDFSPDGRYVLSGGVEAAIRLWDRKTGELIRTYQGHDAGTSIAKFSPDGSRIVTTRGHPQPAVQMWNTESGEVVHEFTWSTGWPTSAAVARDVNLVAAGTQDGKTRVWDTNDGRIVRTITSTAQWITSVAISHDGALLATGGSTFKPVAELWDIATGQSRGQFELEAGSVVALQFSNSGRELLVGWEDGYVRIFNVASGELIRDVVIPAAFLCDAAFSPDDQFILTGEGWPFFTARLWETRSGNLLRVLGLHTAEVNGVAFNREGTQVLTGSDSVQRWSIADSAGRLTTTRVPGGLELRWRHGTLQSSESLEGPWLDVPNASSPHIAPAETANAYFRVNVSEE